MNSFVYLTITQGLILTSGIAELKKNPYFNDPIAENFLQEVKEKSIEITVDSLNFGKNLMQKIMKNGDKIKVARSKFEYVTRLTGIDVFDENVINEFLSQLDGVVFEFDDRVPRLR